MKVIFHIAHAALANAMRLAMLGLFIAGGTHVTAADAEIRFANEDRLTGSLESMAVDHLMWNSPALEKATPFQLSKIVELRLPGNPAPGPADCELVLDLSNGDVVRGKLATVNERAVVLDTAFGGRMEFNRAMIAAARIEATSEVLYRGPTGMDGWRQSGEREVWSYERTSFRSMGVGGIGRDDLLPEACSVSFNVEWKGDSCGMKIFIFSNDAGADTTDTGYELMIQRGSYRLRKCATQNFLGSGNSQLLTVANKARFEIRASQLTGTICLLINERLCDVWADPDFKKNEFGSGLQFYSMSDQAQKLSDIRVGKWDGVVEGVPEGRGGIALRVPGGWGPAKGAATADAAKDGMRLANGDFVSGELVAVDDGMVTVKSGLGEVKLPVDRLRTLSLRALNSERAIRRNGDIRLYTKNGSRLVMRLEAVEQGRLIGSSQNFGQAPIVMDAVERIEFNIYDQALESMRAKSDW